MRVAATAPGPTIAPSMLLGLFAIADAHGVQPDAWLAGSGLTRASLKTADARIPGELAASIIERALPDLPPDVGLQLGHGQHVGNFGLVGLAMSTAATFGEALQIGLQFTPVVGSLMRFVEAAPPEPGLLALAADMTVGNAAIAAFATEEFISSCLALAGNLLGAPLRPVGLDFAYPRPAYAARYREVFACPLRFGQPRTRLLLDAKVLDMPLPTHNPIASWQVLALCQAQMPQTDARTVSAEVARLLDAALADAPKLAAIATRLHVSERTLRRQLHQEGTSFHAIHDRLRIERALALLQEPKLSITAVGAQVGFRDPREFRRAFKRWTGAAPSAARARR